MIGILVPLTVETNRSYSLCVWADFPDAVKRFIAGSKWGGDIDDWTRERLIGYADHQAGKLHIICGEWNFLCHVVKGKEGPRWVCAANNFDANALIGGCT